MKSAKKVKIPIADSGQLSDMFNQMLGTGDVNMAIAYPRYRQMHKLCICLVDLFDIVAKTMLKNPLFVAAEFEIHRKQIVEFCTNARSRCSVLFAMDFSDYEWNYSLVDPEEVTKFTTVYNSVKKDELLHTFVVMCDNLVKYQKYFKDKSAFNPKFITAMAGTEWCPFPFTKLNLKHIFSLMQITQDTITFFMTVIARAYEFSKELFEELRSPDIDVDQFVDVIMQSMDKIQRIPELHRCGEAFAKIKDSVKLLKANFGNYYRDFIETSDSTIIMQHFILDVGKNTNASPRVAAQFRKIIAYYQKIAQDQTANPKMKALFDQVNESFKSLDKKTTNLGKVTVDADDDLNETLEKLDEALADVADDSIDIVDLNIGTANTTVDDFIKNLAESNPGTTYTLMNMGACDDLPEPVVLTRENVSRLGIGNYKKQSFEPKTEDMV